MRRADPLWPLRPPSLAALATLVAGALLVGRAALGFPTGSQFDGDPLASAGGGGEHFTGAPGFPMATCATCHINPARKLEVRLESDDPSLFSLGYQPGTTYHLAVKLVGEHLGLQYDAGGERCGDLGGDYQPCNSNGFALEADNLYGNPVGALCPALPSGGCVRPRGATTMVSMDTIAIHSTGYIESTDNLPAGTENGATQWSFYWTAPPGGTGPVSFHIGAVDGNGGTGTAEISADVFGDDVVEAHITVPEAGADELFASTGCSVGARRASGPIIFAFAILFLALRRWRRRWPS